MSGSRSGGLNVTRLQRLNKIYESVTDLRFASSWDFVGRGIKEQVSDAAWDQVFYVRRRVLGRLKNESKLGIRASIDGRHP